MALGGQSRGLIQASKTAGWDPNIIPAGNGQPAVNINEFNKDPGVPNYADMAGVPLPGDVPHQTRGMEDGYDVNGGADLSPRDDWNTHYQSEPKVRRGTRNANPTPGMPGA